MHALRTRDLIFELFCLTQACNILRNTEIFSIPEISLGKNNYYLVTLHQEREQGFWLMDSAETWGDLFLLRTI